MKNIIALVVFLQELFCWHLWSGVYWGWQKNGFDCSGEYYCAYCGKWRYKRSK